MSDLSRFVQIRPDWSRFRHGSSHWFQRLSDTFWLNARPPVSRVLSPTVGLRRASGGDHPSGTAVTRRLVRPTRRRPGTSHRLSIWSCSRRGLLSRPVTRPLVRSYRTISPLPPSSAATSAAGTGRRYVSVRFPSARAAWELPSALSRGARTFLDAALQLSSNTATARRPGEIHCIAVVGVNDPAPRSPSRRRVG